MTLILLAVVGDNSNVFFCPDFPKSVCVYFSVYLKKKCFLRSGMKHILGAVFVKCNVHVIYFILLCFLQDYFVQLNGL